MLKISNKLFFKVLDIKTEGNSKSNLKKNNIAPLYIL